MTNRTQSIPWLSHTALVPVNLECLATFAPRPLGGSHEGHDAGSLEPACNHASSARHATRATDRRLRLLARRLRSTSDASPHTGALRRLSENAIRSQTSW